MALSAEEGARIYDDAIVIDMTCPLLREARYVDWCREGRMTAVAPTVISATPEPAVTEHSTPLPSPVQR